MLRKRKLVNWFIAAALLTVLYVIGYVHNTEGKEKIESAKNEDSYGSNSTWTFDAAQYIDTKEILVADPYLRHAFNVRVSDSLVVDRDVPDTRDPSCAQENESVSGTNSVSVVISFHNEARSTLLRTIVSILNRSPDKLLKEIILIDDFSDDATDGDLLSTLPKVRVYRNPNRSGLSRSRAYGSELSKGDYLVFLDSHVEVNIGWLQPLLHHLQKHSKRIVSPVIDIIDLDTFDYKPSSGDLKGGIDWKLDFRWQALTKAEMADRTRVSQSFKSPILPGGLFMVKKSWFEEIGGFDKGLEIWGAENIELSLKNWLCGDGVHVIPCSRVGHVFRKRHPYAFPPNGSASVYLRNARRIANVWLEDQENLFYHALPKAKSQLFHSDTSEQLRLKRNLNCKPFQWFLENIYPELSFIHRPYRKDTLALGRLQQGELCLEGGCHKKKNSCFHLYECKEFHVNEEWSFTNSGLLQTNNTCMTAEESPVLKVYLYKCTGQQNQKWIRQRRLLVHKQSGLCLESSTVIKDPLQLSPCQHKTYVQQWDFSIELQAWGDR